MSVLKNVLIGSMIYGSAALLGVAALGERSVPSKLHRNSTINLTMVRYNHNSYLAQKDLDRLSDPGMS